MDHFYFLTDLGETELPTKAEIESLRVNDKSELFLILDSSVCFEIITLINHKKSARVDKSKVFNLIEYIQKNNVDYTPIFALAELCYDRSNLELRDEKLWDFKNKIDFALNYPIKLLKRYNFDFSINFHLKKNQESLDSSVEPIIPRLRLYYTGLLKIHELASQGLKKECAEKNIRLFVDWMKNDLGVFLGLEYNLALEVFGGNTKFLKMLKLGASEDITKKALWGTAWDLFHARVSCNRPQLEMMVNRNIHPVFVTNDQVLYRLMSPQVAQSVKYNTTQLKITTENTYPGHFSDHFMNEINNEILLLSTERIEQETICDIDKIDVMIRELEEKLK